mmetsp:Transcript_47173/g.123774  ORF Transcript_47173/g.123774 Transcript_47173/m.123774 type:complete len:102 (+) Transcript_47173:222-527(+)
METVVAWRLWQLDESCWPCNEGFYIDEHPFYKPGFDCVQGSLSLIDIIPDSGGLQLVQWSHIEEARARLRQHYHCGGDWCPPGDDETRSWCMVASAGLLVL